MTNATANGMSLATMLAYNAAQFRSRAALLGESGRLSHEELFAQVGATVRALNKFGLGRGDRVALALPQGPELAVAFLAVAAGMTAAPLNPACLENEFTAGLQDLPARALILMAGSDSPARAAARRRGVPILELTASPEGDGRFTLSGDAPATAGATAGWAEAEEVALILSTSGTTARPKRVPLSHANLCASARHIAATLHLQPGDISLAIMPLFHIHGLVASLLAALAAGGGCACAGTFSPGQFPRWLEAWRPTWFSAVPTMHQAILDEARGHSLRSHSLRFIRSSSAALPPPVMAALEEVFGVPVIESYGMTEAAHQMASNPLPPHPRKPGSVGLAAGPEVAILDADGSAQETGRIGEIAIRGPNVMRGYEENPEANAAAFCRGWLRTGDQGWRDADGYLFITGRLKELINRGGEKIAPREVDEVLLAHPAIRQAVAFAVPHSSLGEDLAAAVVLRPQAVCDEAELRAFAFDRLPAFKVPSRIIFVSEVPRGATGKIQRIGLADRLAESLTIAYDPPATDTEKLVAAAMGEILRRPRVGRNDNFFHLGGDSLRATQVVIRLQQKLAPDLPVGLLFRLPTPALLAARLEELLAAHEIESLAAALSSLSPEDQARLLGEPPTP